MGNGTPWQLPRAQIMTRIRAGDQFFVRSIQPGSTAKTLVRIYYLDKTHPYLATAPDVTTQDNLLALPQRPPS